MNIIRVCEVASTIRNEYKDSVYIRRDIYNARTKFRRYNFDNYIPTIILLKTFDKNDINYIKKIDLEDEIRLFSIIFTFPQYISIVKRFYKIIIVNNIYNTN